MALYAVWSSPPPASRPHAAAAAAQPRILWGPIPIINIRYASIADRLQGFESATLVYEVYRINARDQFDYVLDRFAAVPIAGKLVPYAAFLWAGLRFDVFVFYFDGGLLYATPWWRAELALLRAAGHDVVVVPYGGDARLPSTTRGRGPWNAYTDVRRAEEDRDERDVHGANRGVRPLRERHARVRRHLRGPAPSGRDVPISRTTREACDRPSRRTGSRRP